MNNAMITRAVFLIAACGGPLCAADLINDPCINESNRPIVLIAMKNSDFKDSAITIVKHSLESRSNCVKIVPLGDLKNEEADNYRAVLIVGSDHFGGMGSSAKKFLRKLGESQKVKVLLFITSGGGDWRPKNTGVDCVTSASRLSGAATAAKTIIEKIFAMLNGKN
jgi:hypothetical protein